MNSDSSRLRPWFWWMVPGLVVGLVVGGAATWWLMRRGLAGEAQRLARVMVAEQTAGPRTPAAPSSGSVERAAGAGGGRWSAIPVVAVGDNLESTCQALLAIQDPSVRQAALSKLLEALPQQRWGEFLASMKKLGERGEFDDQPGSFLAALSVMESAFSFMVQRAPEDLLALVIPARTGQESNNDDERDEGTAVMAFRFWAGRDLPAAMAYFEKNLRSLPPNSQSEAAKGLAREFVKKDPAAAFAWIKGLPKENQSQVAHGAFQTLSHTDSAAALRFLVTEKDLPDRDQFAEQIARGWAATKPEEALAWAKQLPTDLATSAISGAMVPLAAKDFASAVDETSKLPPRQLEAGLHALAGQVKDIAQVAEVVRLVEAAGEGTGRQEAAKAALKVWTAQDPEAASVWVAAQPDGPTRDAAIQGFGNAAVVSKKDPEAGLEWTAAIVNPGERGRWLGENVKAWTEYDAAAARAWVESSQRLNDVDRETLLPLTRK